jgi:Secretion system C-terminal sorting domain
MMNISYLAMSHDNQTSPRILGASQSLLRSRCFLAVFGLLFVAMTALTNSLEARTGKTALGRADAPATKSDPNKPIAASKGAVLRYKPTSTANSQMLTTPNTRAVNTQPTVAIVSDVENDMICGSNEMVTFKATRTYPDDVITNRWVYTWYKNGVALNPGTTIDSATTGIYAGVTFFRLSGLRAGDVIRCEMSSTNVTLTGPVVSNNITIKAPAPVGNAVIDQCHVLRIPVTPPFNIAQTINSYLQGQSFKAGINGHLAGVEVYLAHTEVDPNCADLTNNSAIHVYNKAMSFTATDFIGASDTISTTKSHAQNTLFSNYKVLNNGIRSPVAVAAGKEYNFFIESFNNPCGDNTVMKTKTVSNQLYTNGDAVSRSGSSLVYNTTQDLVFKTYVTPCINLVAPTLSIAPRNDTSVCTNVGNITLTAKWTGVSPSGFKWYRNGVFVMGGQVGTFDGRALLPGGDVITCEIITEDPCFANVQIVSNQLLIRNSNPVPAVTVASDVNNVCAGTSVTFTPTFTIPNTGTEYTWYKNEVAVATTATYTSTSFANGDSVRVEVKHKDACGEIRTITSAWSKMTIKPLILPSVFIAADKNNVCAGTSVSFTPIITNGGTGPTYQWKRNGVNLTNAMGGSYTTDTLRNNDVITCTITSNEQCLAAGSATSNGLTMTVNPIVTPTIAISVPNTSLCTGATATFTSTIENGGAAPMYQWKENGIDIPGATSATYSVSDLVTGDDITCVLTSNATCLPNAASTATATSNELEVTVQTSYVPTVSVMSSRGNMVCAGDTVRFTATPTNGGTNPIYIWKKNGINVGSSSTYSTTDLTSGDVITCSMTSNLDCRSMNTATSSPINMTVNPYVAPSVVISTLSSTICKGTWTVFKATPTNGGNFPLYQWKVNGVDTSTLAEYRDTLRDGDVVTCVMTGSAGCATATTATSNNIALKVNPIVTPTIRIATPLTTACMGSVSTFTPTITNGGARPTYQWQRIPKTPTSGPAVNVSTNEVYSLTNSSPNTTNGTFDIRCIFTSSDTCSTVASVTSSVIEMEVRPSFQPSVSIDVSTPSTTFCEGTSATFTPTPMNGGLTPTYQWRRNGVNVATGATYTAANFATGDVVSAILTSSLACSVAPNTTPSNDIRLTVNPYVAPSVRISTADASICVGERTTFNAAPTNGGSLPTYKWRRNGDSVAVGASYVTDTLRNNDVITCDIVSNAMCLSTTAATSNSIKMAVSSNLMPTIAIATRETTVCNNGTATFTSTITNGGDSPVYQWKKNGVGVSTTANYTATGLNNNDVITCSLISSAECASSAPVNSNSVTMMTAVSLIPTVAIAATNTSICSGASVTFTPTPTYGGSAPTYQWQKNGVDIPNATGATYMTSDIANGDKITAFMTSNLSCRSINSVNSNDITMAVTQSVTPTVAITTPNTTVCNGSSVTFSAAATNGGESPTYLWTRNGNNVSRDATYTTTDLINGDVVKVDLTSSATCRTANTVSSNNIAMTVNAPSPPAVVITTPSAAICAGANATFSAAITNGGNAPTYQWKKNGVDVSTSASYTASDLVNADVISLVVTSNSDCRSANTATSNNVTMTVNPLLTPTIAINTPNLAICEGTTASFSAITSNAGLAPTYQWKKNGTNVSTDANYTASGLVSGDVISCVLTSNAECLAAQTANSNSVTMTVNSSLTPSVVVAASKTISCVGASVTFTPTPTNGGTAPTYQWKKNSVDVATGATYTTSSLVTGDTISAMMTSTAECRSANSANSNKVVMTVEAPTPPTIAITTPTATVCKAASITFSSATTNGGSAPTYQWKKNGVDIATGATFVTSDLANNDTITCIVTSNSECRSTDNATSNSIIMSVKELITPTIAIASPDNNAAVCLNSSVTFTSNVTNGGATPIYQWKKNGTDVATGATYITSTLANNDVITCALTSNAECLATPTVTSNSVTMTVATSLTPMAVITASNTTICAGGSVTFTPSSTNSGPNPVYQWQKNGVDISTGATFTATNLANGDVINAVVTSTLECRSANSATSNRITMVVNPLVTPTVAVTTPNTTICAGTSVTFTPTPTNGGAAPTYKWLRNGVDVASTPTYTATDLTNGELISCIMTSNAECRAANTANSNLVTMTVNPTVVPTVAIATPFTTVCTSERITFTATTTNGGTTPTYQWQKNGTPIASATMATYTATDLANNDEISCVLTSTATCPSPSSVTSNKIKMSVSASLVPAIAISATNTTICPGTSVTFSLTPTNGGTAPTYQWKKNGTNVATTTTYTATDLANGDVITCVMTSNSECRSSNTVTSNSITMSVPNTTVGVSPLTPAICEGQSITLTATAGFTNYLWSNGATTQSITVNSIGSYSVTVTNSNGCKSNITIPVTSSAKPTAEFGFTIQGGKVTLLNISSNANTFFWLFSGLRDSISNEVSPTINYAENGVYKICLLASTNGGCRDSICKNVAITRVGTKELPAGLNVKISPNPTSGSFEVLLDVQKPFNQADRLFVTDILGRVVASLEPQMGSNRINIDQFTQGAYIVSLRMDGRIYVLEKVMKQN